jgi:nucleoside 2-deoxyribosyltransferase
MNTLVADGHSITFDWTESISQSMNGKMFSNGDFEDLVYKDIEGVRSADCVVCYPVTGLSPGAMFEVGVAVSFGIPVFVLASSSYNPYHFFFNHQLIATITGVDNLLIALREMQEREKVLT